MCEQAGCKAYLYDDLIVLEKYLELSSVFAAQLWSLRPGKLFDISRFKCCILSALAVQLKIQLRVVSKTFRQDY